MNKAAQLLQLKTIADAALQAELGKLSEIQRREEALKEQINALAQSRVNAVQAFDLTHAVAAPVQSAVHENWSRWAERKIRELSARLAQVHAEQEEQKIKAQRAFGKLSALEKLQSKLSK